MQARELQDLLEGRNEWCNIPDVIRNTFSIFNELIQQQAKHIQRLESSTNEYFTHQEHQTINLQSNLSELTDSLSRFNRIHQESLSDLAASTSASLDRTTNQV